MREERSRTMRALTTRERFTSWKMRMRVVRGETVEFTKQHLITGLFIFETSLKIKKKIYKAELFVLIMEFDDF